MPKLPGSGQGIILLLTHYDTLRLDNFVGAEDGGSSTGLMLEMARILCGARKAAQLGVDCVSRWRRSASRSGSDTDSVYGSRELAARLAVSGDLKRVRAVILADMIGQKDLQIPRESNSTKWLTDLVWKTAARLGYGNVFISSESRYRGRSRAVSASRSSVRGHHRFRRIPSSTYWHTPQDTLDKISPRSLAIVGHVILESVAELQNKFH